MLGELFFLTKVEKITLRIQQLALSLQHRLLLRYRTKRNQKKILDIFVCGVLALFRTFFIYLL